MKVIYKYQIYVGSNKLTLPAGAIPRAVGGQDDVLFLWVEHVNSDVPLTPRIFNVYPTGQALTTQPEQYIGTIFNGPYVWHVYEQA